LYHKTEGNSTAIQPITPKESVYSWEKSTLVIYCHMATKKMKQMLVLLYKKQSTRDDKMALLIVTTKTTINSSSSPGH